MRSEQSSRLSNRHNILSSFHQPKQEKKIWKFLYERRFHFADGSVSIRNFITNPIPHGMGDFLLDFIIDSDSFSSTRYQRR